MMAARLAAIANQCGGIRPGSATPGKPAGSGICESAPIEEQAPSDRLPYHRPERSTLSIRPIIYRAYGAVFYFPTIPSLTGAISLTRKLLLWRQWSSPKTSLCPANLQAKKTRRSGFTRYPFSLCRFLQHIPGTVPVLCESLATASWTSQPHCGADFVLPYEAGISSVCMSASDGTSSLKSHQLKPPRRTVFGGLGVAYLSATFRN